MPYLKDNEIVKITIDLLGNLKDYNATDFTLRSLEVILSLLRLLNSLIVL
ncbi:MAG: hypothetical protein N2166_01970 [candidate division WOR-3 bacterium]|nr:hypothetical protein [candidate division WOR-3 bacterium]